MNASASDPCLIATLQSVFQELNRRGVRYGVLRNYERLPSLERDGDATARTDVDLVMDSRDVPIWREIAEDIAGQQGWDVLTECDHWMQSSARHHNIEVFRFYRISPLEFLQVDVFHGYNLCGVPLLEEQELLEGSIIPAGRPCRCVDPAKENLFRLQQIHGLAETNLSAKKMARYRSKVLQYWESDRERYEEMIRKYFRGFGLQALDALQQRDLARFRWNMRCAKAWFFARFALRRPVRSFSYLMSRVQDNRKRFLTRQCGCVINAYAPGQEHRRLIKSVLDELAARNVFARWKEKEAGSPITASQRIAMEQGCPVIQWTGRKVARIDLSKSLDSSILTREIVRILVQQDTVLFSLSPLSDWDNNVTRQGTL